MSELNYRIKLKKGDLEIEVQGDKEWVNAKFKELSAQISLNVPTKLEPESTSIASSTLGEFIGEKGNTKKHSELITILAYWLLKRENQKTFNAKDIASLYDSTRRTKPKNINQHINSNVAQALFAESNEKKDGLKAWFLTNTGEEFVNSLK